MNNFKTLTYLAGYFLISTLLLISCQKEADSQALAIDRVETIQDFDNLDKDDGFSFVLPKGMEKNNSELKEIFSELTEKKLDVLIENYRISQYLISIGKYENVYKEVIDGGLLTDLDLKKMLSKVEHTDLENFTTDQLVESRACYYEYCPIEGWSFDVSPYPCGWGVPDVHVFEKVKICNGWAISRSYWASCNKPYQQTECFSSTIF